MSGLAGTVTHRAGRKARAHAWVWSGLWGLVLTALAAPSTRAAGPLKIGEVSYVAADAWFGRYGLEASPGPTAGTRRYASAWSDIVLERDSREIMYDDLRVFLGDAVAVREGQFYLSALDAEALFAPLLRSRDYAATARPLRLIVLDAGHGGQDSGTSNPRLKLVEKDLTLDVVRRLGEILRSQGFVVRYTRENDTYVSLRERADFARSAAADLFVSIHFNATEAKATVRGTETYVLTPRYQRSTASENREAGDAVEQAGNAADPWNAVLGFQMHRALKGELATFDRGLKRARFAVLRLIDCPGVLIESGYLSNDAEARRIATPAYRAQLAQAVAVGILNYANRVAAARQP